MNQSIEHLEGPFKDLRQGDYIRIYYQNDVVANMKLTAVRKYSLIGYDGTSRCKITLLPVTKEIRFYGETGPNRQTVLKGVSIKRFNSMGMEKG